MRFRMPSPTRRSDSSQLMFRQRVPLDVVERVRGRTLLIDLPAFGADPEVTVATSIGDFVKFSL